MTALVEQMMYFGDAPWHKLGIELKEVPTSEKAIVAAGLDWKVCREKIWFKDLDEQMVPIDHGFAIRRLDKVGPKSIIGIVGKRYTPVQNINAFNFFDTIVEENKAIYHTAGSLDNGKVIWILAKLPDGLEISSNDNIELFTLLMNRHDGKRSLIVQPTPIRVVCMNTLSMALAESTNRLSFRHTANVDQQMKMAALTLAHSLAAFSKTKEAFKTLVLKDVSQSSLNEYYDNVLDITEIISKKKLEKKTRLNQIFQADLEISKSKPSLWIAYNSVTYLADHELGKNDDKRLLSSWLGSSNMLKQKALSAALQVAA